MVIFDPQSPHAKKILKEQANLMTIGVDMGYGSCGGGELHRTSGIFPGNTERAPAIPLVSRRKSKA